ncbi:MAG TPA: hypothetical protein VJG83_04375 [archaeon]|nr:hypothetical protein [archaeon]
MQYYHLPFCVLKITNAQKFLHAISSNTQNAARNSFLDIFGKIVVCFYQNYNGTDALVAFPEKFKTRFNEHVQKYLAISKAKIEQTNLNAYFIDAHAEQKEVEQIDGLRVPEKDSFILLSEKPPKKIDEMAEEKFNCFCLEHSISMQGREFDEEMIMNTDWKDAVSFSKGCFLGQEIVVKIMHRGKPPRKLIVLQFENEPTALTRNGAVIGEIRSKCFSKKTGKWLAYCSIPNDDGNFDKGFTFK